ncbi:hypothetical protein GCM10007207_17710 [Asaia siamensis]|uniref:Resolvase-like protein n=1 Tax=Asaia siamensis TaxID=110479 RepID=A0ABQ1M0H6_9PROT|nr:hypothetical protein AA0323_2708 [Asaia siamensis NRIC 0323]GGC32679.1 hypothetical protein GCM10007207_17710 [Asaia siamensis]
MNEFDREIASLRDVCRSHIDGGIDLIFLQSKIRLTEDIIYSFENRFITKFLSKMENKLESIIYTIDERDRGKAADNVCSEIIEYFIKKRPRT